MQLCHAGRVSHPTLQPGGALPVAPSAVAKAGTVRVTENEELGVKQIPAPTPRALETYEIPQIVEGFKRAAERAVSAGFDGIELHSGSGLLHQQFLTTSANRRKDRYGGSVLNRCRFVLETLEALCAVRGPGRVGIKLAPNFAYNGTEMRMDDMLKTYAFLARALSGLNLAYVHVHYPPWNLFLGPKEFDPIDFIRPLYKGTLVGGGEFDRHSAEKALATGRCDLIAFGRRMLANPDLPRRFLLDAEENGWDDATLYTPTPQGFTDYPTLEEARARQQA